MPPDPIDPRIQGAIRLMTASPKLLAACKKLVAWVAGDGPWDVDAATIVEEAKAAIAEAEGTDA